MGGRGAFINVDKNAFSFVDNGKTFSIIGEIDGVEVIEKDSKVSVKALEYSHTKNRIYAVVQDDKLKHLDFYDENHKQAKCIDFLYSHGGVKPHIHIYMNHAKNSPSILPTKKELEIANKICQKFNVSML